MANFNLHLNCAAVITGITSGFCYYVGLVTHYDALLLWLVGVIGGLLPDVDSKNSFSLKIVFNLLVILLGVFMFVEHKSNLMLYQVLIIIGIIYGILRWMALPLFCKYTKHRGNWHSLLACTFAASLLCSLSWNVFDFSIRMSWLIGIFLFLGFLVHLILDEIYAIDFINFRLKSSFGTALKICSFKYFNTSLSIFVMQLLLTPKMPPWNELHVIFIFMINALG